MVHFAATIYDKMRVKDKKEKLLELWDIFFATFFIVFLLVRFSSSEMATGTGVVSVVIDPVGWIVISAISSWYQNRSGLILRLTKTTSRHDFTQFYPKVRLLGLPKRCIIKYLPSNFRCEYCDLVSLLWICPSLSLQLTFAIVILGPHITTGHKYNQNWPFVTIKQCWRYFQSPLICFPFTFLVALLELLHSCIILTRLRS